MSKKLTVRNVDTLIIFTDLLIAINKCSPRIMEEDRDAIGQKAAELFDALTKDGADADAMLEDLTRARHGVEVSVSEHKRLREENTALRQVNVTGEVRKILCAEGWTAAQVADPHSSAAFASSNADTIKSARLIITR